MDAARQVKNTDAGSPVKNTDAGSQVDNIDTETEMKAIDAGSHDENRDADHRWVMMTLCRRLCSPADLPAVPDTSAKPELLPDDRASPRARVSCECCGSGTRDEEVTEGFTILPALSLDGERTDGDLEYGSVTGGDLAALAVTSVPAAVKLSCLTHEAADSVRHSDPPAVPFSGQNR